MAFFPRQSVSTYHTFENIDQIGDKIKGSSLLIYDIKTDQVRALTVYHSIHTCIYNDKLIVTKQ